MIHLSIGIPTYERPDLLKRLINSIYNQKGVDRFNIEILIGDDSKNQLQPNFFDDHLALNPDIIFNYNFHSPPKGQNENVASLIERATGQYFCLMHDDDFFLEGSLKILLECAIQNSDCIVFGKQVLYDREFDYKTSEVVNTFFKRNSPYSGKQEDSIKMAMLQQCPNDGYILSTKNAKNVGCRPDNVIGSACDFDFALRAALTDKLNFYFLDQFTTVYSITGDSVTLSYHNNAVERKLKILYEFKTDVTHPETFKSVLKSDLSMVISHYILTKKYNEAKKYLYSFKNIINYLWYKPATYLQFFKLILKR